MKNHIYIFLALSASLLSCDKDLLDQKPLDALSEADVWTDPKLAELFVNDLYSQIPEGLDRYGMLDAGSDEAENTFGWAFSQPFNRSEFTADNAPLNGKWGDFYKSIRATNTCLENIDALPAIDSVRNHLKGEAKFLRAYFYFELVKHFGGVPLILNVPQLDDDLMVPRNSYQECVNFIVTESTEAASLLPKVQTGSNVGRAEKGTALALKTRMLLYASKWSEAAAAAKEVMALGLYNLNSSYEGVFKNRNNSEIIFDYQHLAPNKSTSADLVNNPIGYGGWGGTCPTQEFVDSYEMIDGESIEDSPLYDENNPYENRDPRFTATVLYNGNMFKGRAVETFVGGLDGYGTNGDATKTGYYMKKWLDENVKNVYNDKNSTNWIIFRYAEILLNYAEAQNEAIGPDGSVYDAMKKVRLRAGLPELPAGLSQPQMRDRIRNERRVELAFEEHRFWDIRRWRIATTVGNGPVHGTKITKDINDDFMYEKFVVEDRIFLERNYLMPIPQSEIVKNTNLEQNPGY